MLNPQPEKGESTQFQQKEHAMENVLQYFYLSAWTSFISLIAPHGADDIIRKTLKMG